MCFNEVNRSTPAKTFCEFLELINQIYGGFEQLKVSFEDIKFNENYQNLFLLEKELDEKSDNSSHIPTIIEESIKTKTNPV